MLLALIDVFNRDLRYLLNNLLTVWFFLVPIVYHRRMVERPAPLVTAVDPMRWIVDQFRDVLYDGRIDRPASTCSPCWPAAVLFLPAWPSSGALPSTWPRTSDRRGQGALAPGRRRSGRSPAPGGCRPRPSMRGRTRCFVPAPTGRAGADHVGGVEEVLAGQSSRKPTSARSAFALPARRGCGPRRTARGRCGGPPPGQGVAGPDQRVAGGCRGSARDARRARAGGPARPATERRSAGSSKWSRVEVDSTPSKEPPAKPAPTRRR